MENTKKLYRSRANRILAGVSGGLGEYFDIDPIIVRIIFILLALGHGAGVLIYVILALVIPSNPGQFKTKSDLGEKAKEVARELNDKAQKLAEDIRDRRKEEYPNPRQSRNRGRNIIGFILIIIGLVALANVFFPLDWLGWNVFWPLIMIAIGFFLIFRDREDRPYSRRQNQDAKENSNTINN